MAGNVRERDAVSLIVGGKVVAGKSAFVMMKRKPEHFVQGYEENKNILILR